MDTIIINKLEIFANHGVFEAENILGQKFIISATFSLNLHTATIHDDISSSVNYGTLCTEINEFLTQNTFKLIETCAEKLIEHLFILHKELQKIDLTIEKPWAPIKLPLQSVAINLKRSRHYAYIALGSNLGDSTAYLNNALQILNNHPLCTLINTSSFITTKAYGNTNQPDFLNAVCLIETLLSSQDLLDFLHSIEANAKRERLEHWGPRTLDLDIIFYDEEIINTPTLTIPHLDMQNRTFVLEPLNQIAPYYMHPILKQTVSQLLAKLHPNF